MTIYNIIEELNESNGSIHKMDVLRKHEDNKLLQRVLKMTYDSCAFTYGITMRNIEYVANSAPKNKTIEEVLDIVEAEFVTRNTTGNDAIKLLTELFAQLSEADANVLKGVINRDLRINMGRSNINKVFKNLIVKPVYMRCGMFNDKTKNKFEATNSFIELKADGTYREFRNENGNVTCQSRSGEKYDYPLIYKVIEDKPDGVFFGELTVYRDGELLPRAIGNGLLRKDEFPDNCHVVFDCWDVVSLDEYAKAGNKLKCEETFEARRKKVRDMFPDHTADPLTNHVRAIESHPVNNRQEALKYVMKWMNDDKEGGVWKEAGGLFKDGTSSQQLKLKLDIDIEVRVTGFKEGSKGTAREKTFGSMTFATDDGKINGACSGFSDKQLKDFNSRREELIGKIITVCCNDITKGSDSEIWALSHPRFIEIREDRDDTDTFERAQEAKRMAMELS